MMSVMPVHVNGGTYIKVKARDVVIMARNAIKNKRDDMVREALKECMEEECVHHVPNTGITMQYAPEIRHAEDDGWGDMMVCESLKEMALWLMNESGYPEELQVMNLSLNDFRSLK